MTRGGGRHFLESFTPFASRIAHFGRINSLAQTLLKLTMPGVPDIYQGNELWDLSLVDPDNRRPVDYARRQACFAELDRLKEALGPAEFSQQLLDEASGGWGKLHLIRVALGLRREHEALFSTGRYLPLAVEGEPGWPLGAVWQDTRVRLPAVTRRWRNALTGEGFKLDQGGEEMPLIELMANFPLALLVAEGDG